TLGAAVNLTGGNGGQGAQGGAGGNLSAKGVSIQESGSASNLNLDAGAGGTGTTGPGGNGGNAALTMTAVQLTNGTGMALLGGNGGSSASGSGGNGGNAAVSIGTIDVEGQSSLALDAGAGGSSASGTGGNGGSALVLAQSVTLATNGNLTLKGGDGGSSGGAAGGVGVGFQNAFIDSGSTLNLITGQATTGPVGVVVASIGDLTGAGDIVVTGAGSVLQVGSGSFSGSLSGTESLIQNSSAGALTLSGANSYSGGTTVGGGTLVLDTGGSLGTGGVFVQASKTLQYIDQASAGFENVANSGLMLFNGQSTAGNAQVVDNGAVSFEDQSSAGTATFNLSGTGSVDFSDTAQGGTARFILGGTSTMDLSSSAAGTVTVGSMEGAGFVSLGAGALAVGSNNLSTSFAGQISDGNAGGSLVKLGSGAMTLVGGANTYTGGTLLEQGQLVLGDPFTVSGGVTSASSFNYLGSGSVTIAGGELSMASSTGSQGLLQVGGNYVQAAGTTLQLSFYGAGLSGADAINVNGAVTLGGTLDLEAGQGFQATTVLGGTGTELISGISLSGRFQKIQESFGGTLRLLPIYEPDSLLVTNIILSFADEAATPNQKAVAADLDKVYLAPDLEHLIFALGGQSDAVSLRTAYDELSPSSFSVIYQSAFENALLRASEVEDRLAQLREGPDAPSPAARRVSLESARFAGNLSVADEMAMIVRLPSPSDGGGVWGGFFSGGGGLFDVGSTQNAPGFRDTSYGVPAAGIDYQVSRQLALGFLAGYGESDISLNANGSITQTGAQVGLYGTWHPNRAYVDALVVGGLNQYSSQRQTYNGDVGGKTQGFEVDGRLTGGYDWKGKDWALGPSLAAQWTHVAINGFTEKGSVDTLVMPDQSQDSIMSLASFHAQARIHVGGIFFEPEAQASWEHEFAYQGGVVQAGFGQGDNFSVEGPAIGQDGFLVRGSLNTAFTPQLVLSLGYQGELGRTNLTSNQFDAGMKFGF
ncbi:MAG TPA: autotransporter domain-containing protein, partial [bacterium]|nr:autotransporter domain-containing protein [bacterium]